MSTGPEPNRRIRTSPGGYDGKNRRLRWLKIALSVGSALLADVGAGQAVDVPRISPAEFRQHIVALDIVDQAVPAAEAVLRAYVAQREGADRAWDTIARWISSLSPLVYHGSDPAFSQQLSLAFENGRYRWGVEVRRLEDEYFGAISVLGSAGTLNGVEALKRSRRRVVLLRAENMPPDAPVGWDVDLLEMLAQLGIEPPGDTDLGAVLFGYDLELDTLLVQLDSIVLSRDRDAVKRYQAMQAAVEDRGESGAKAQIHELGRTLARPYAACSAIRQLHEKTIESLLALLRSSDAALVGPEVNLRLFPFVYADSETPAVLQRVETLHLTDSQRDALQAIEIVFLADQAVAARRCAKLYRLRTSRVSYESYYQDLAVMIARGENILPPRDHAFAFDEAVAAWKQSDLAFTGRILDVLTPEQNKTMGIREP